MSPRLSIIDYLSANQDYGGTWDTLGCKLTKTNDTHSECTCQHMSDYALLLEDYTPVRYRSNDRLIDKSINRSIFQNGRLPDVAYYICYGIYVVSILLLVYLMFLVVACELG